MINLWMLVGVALIFVRSAAAAPPKAMLGYYPNDSAYGSLTRYSGAITQLSTDSFAVTANGDIEGTTPDKAVALARAKRIGVFACLSNFNQSDFDPALAHTVLSNPATVNKLVKGLVALVRENRYNGVNLDFESVDKADRAAYTAFVHKVALAMRAGHYTTIISVPAKLNDDPTDGWTGAFDFAALGKDVDVLQLMTYDQHGPWSEPGPVAGYDWVEPAVRYTISVVPPAKVSLGLAAYGYDWNRTKKTGAQVPWKEIPGLIARQKASPRRAAAAASPYFTYVAGDGSQHTVWYEDAASIEKKTKLALTYNLAGVSVWAMGMEDGTFWEAIARGLTTK